MATRRTLERPRCNDEWSFSGRGRWLYAQERRTPPLALGQTDLDGPPREGAPVDPGEPRG